MGHTLKYVENPRTVPIASVCRIVLYGNQACPGSLVGIYQPTNSYWQCNAINQRKKERERALARQLMRVAIDRYAINEEKDVAAIC